jgi:MYXO-CTERM domain-containing protein
VRTTEVKPEATHPALSGPPSGPTGAPNFYTGNLAGTSFSAPIIAGGAALLNDVAYDQFPDNPAAHDNRVIKAVLQNSADKLAGWDNGQFDTGSELLTFQSLDLTTGTGVMNLDRAYDQFVAGTTDLPGLFGGTIESIGWDFGMVGDGTPVEYFFDDLLLGGSTLNATLTWNRDRSFDFLTGNAWDDSFDDLDLEIWRMLDDGSDDLVAASVSTFNNVEHLSITLPETGQYKLRVNWFQEIFDLVGDTNEEYFGLAWAGVPFQDPDQPIPEPASVVVWFGLIGLVGLLFRRRRQGS